MWWLAPVNPSAQESEARNSEVQSQPGRGEEGGEGENLKEESKLHLELEWGVTPFHPTCPSTAQMPRRGEQTLPGNRL